MGSIRSIDLQEPCGHDKSYNEQNANLCLHYLISKFLNRESTPVEQLVAGFRLSKAKYKFTVDLFFNIRTQNQPFLPISLLLSFRTKNCFIKHQEPLEPNSAKEQMGAYTCFRTTITTTSLYLHIYGSIHIHEVLPPPKKKKIWIFFPKATEKQQHFNLVKRLSNQKEEGSSSR